MAVHKGQENADPPPRRVTEAQFGRRPGWPDRRHTAVRWGANTPEASRRHALRVAKKEQTEEREQEAQPGEPVRQQQAQDEHDYAAENERPSGAMRRGQNV